MATTKKSHPSGKKYGMGRIKELLTLPSAEPMYVPNIISYADFKYYRWYALTILPILKLAGGNMEWSGHPVEMIHGEAQCQNLMVVRYPSHRHFIRMIANPYYAAINKLREKGVAKFEGAFSEGVTGHGKNLHGKRKLLVVHFNADEPKPMFEQAEAMLNKHGAEPLLSVSQYLALELMPRPKPTDPNPLTYQRNMFFAIDDVSDELRAAITVLAADLGDCLVGVYKRSSEKALLPGQPMPDYLS